MKNFTFARIRNYQFLHGRTGIYSFFVFCFLYLSPAALPQIYLRPAGFPGWLH